MIFKPLLIYPMADTQGPHKSWTSRARKPMDASLDTRAVTQRPGAMGNESMGPSIADGDESLWTKCRFAGVMRKVPGDTQKNVTAQTRISLSIALL